MVGPALALNATVRAFTTGSLCDDSTMASDHVDGRATPTLDGAVLDSEIFDSREFDTVVIAFGEVGDADVP